MRLICNRTQNDAIGILIALFLTNQIAENTIDFKMNVINGEIMKFKFHNLKRVVSLTTMACARKSNFDLIDKKFIERSIAAQNVTQTSLFLIS